jgi:hypothetical protein
VLPRGLLSGRTEADPLLMSLLIVLRWLPGLAVTLRPRSLRLVLLAVGLLRPPRIEWLCHVWLPPVRRGMRR